MVSFIFTNKIDVKILPSTNLLGLWCLNLVHFDSMMTSLRFNKLRLLCSLQSTIDRFRSRLSITFFELAKLCLVLLLIPFEALFCEDSLVKFWCHWFLNTASVMSWFFASSLDWNVCSFWMWSDVQFSASKVYTYSDISLCGASFWMSFSFNFCELKWWIFDSLIF